MHICWEIKTEITHERTIVDRSMLLAEYTHYISLNSITIELDSFRENKISDWK